MSEHVLVEPCDECMDLAEDYRDAVIELEDARNQLRLVREENDQLRTERDKARQAYERLLGDERGEYGGDV